VKKVNPKTLKATRARAQRAADQRAKARKPKGATTSAQHYARQLFEALASASDEDAFELRAELIALAKAAGKPGDVTPPDRAFNRVRGLRRILEQLDHEIERGLPEPHRRLRAHVRLARRKWGSLLGSAPARIGGFIPSTAMRERFHDSPEDREMNEALCAVLDAKAYPEARAAGVAALEKVAGLRHGKSRPHPRASFLAGLRRMLLSDLAGSTHPTGDGAREPQIRLEAAVDLLEGMRPTERSANCLTVLREATYSDNPKRKVVLARQVLGEFRDYFRRAIDMGRPAHESIRQAARQLEHVACAAGPGADRDELLDIIDEVERTAMPNAALADLRRRIERGS
jgi:hypothetical protein